VAAAVKQGEEERGAGCGSEKEVEARVGGPGEGCEQERGESEDACAESDSRAGHDLGAGRGGTGFPAGDGVAVEPGERGEAGKQGSEGRDGGRAEIAEARDGRDGAAEGEEKADEEFFGKEW
jgi:hypothetical protein